jgi:hypothetical protein
MKSRARKWYARVMRWHSAFGVRRARHRRWALGLATFVLTTTARAGDRGPYLGASGGVFAGAGFEGLSVPAAGFDFATGYRFTRGVSLEGFFDAWFDFQPYREPSEGAACSGESTLQWHWQTFGLRLWGHVARGKHVEFEVAPPWLGIGIAYEARRSVLTPSNYCYSKPRDGAASIVVFGLIAFALDVKLDEHFSLRLWSGAEIDLAQNVGLGVLALTGNFGPTVRF